MRKQKTSSIHEAFAHNARLAMKNIKCYGKTPKYITEDKIKIPSKYICINCKKQKVELFCGAKFSELKQSNVMGFAGTIQTINIGYGSIHDMESFVIAFCDPCITKLSKKKHILQLP